MERNNYGSTEFNQENIITLPEAVESVGCGKYQTKLYFLIGIMETSEAMELMLLTILSPTLRCQWQLSDSQVALITTVVFAGMVLGSPTFGMISDKFGRKMGLCSGALLIIISGLLSAIAPSYIWFLLFRGLVGFGVGSIPLCSATFCEYLPKKWRGKMIISLLFFWASGSIFESLLGLVVIDRMGWRWFLAFTALPMIIFLILALKSRGRISDLFSRDFRLITVLHGSLWFLTIFTYYGFALLTTVIFAKRDDSINFKSGVFNQTTANSSICQTLTQSGYRSLAITSAGEMPGNLMSLLLIDRIGRKKTLCIELVTLMASFAFLFAPIKGILLNICVLVSRGMCLATNSVLTVATPESYPTQIRAVGLGTCSGFSRLAAMIAPFVAQIGYSSSVDIPLGIFSAFTMVATFITLLLPNEAIIDNT